MQVADADTEHSGALNFRLLERDVAVKLDRLKFTAEANPVNALMNVPGVQRTESHSLRPDQWFRGYWRIHRFAGPRSIPGIVVETDPCDWLPKYRITMCADDTTGILADDLEPIVAAAAPLELRFLELALDFNRDCGVDRDFVRRFGVFGRSKLEQRRANPHSDRWGKSRSGKLAVSYFKESISVHRVEVRMNRRFLQRNSIRGLRDFPRLCGVLGPKHMMFADLDHGRLESKLQVAGLDAAAARGILTRVRQLRPDLSMVLDYLRHEVRLKNVQRVLSPLSMNRAITVAIRRWSMPW